MPKQGKRLRVLTWHVHGNYLWYLTHTNVDFYLPVKRDTHGSFLPGYNGRGDWPLGNNVRDIPAEQVQHEKFDCVLFQNRQNYLEDQYALLTPEQRALPRIYLEHDTPWESPTEQRHWVDGDDLLLVHVTPFNALMWDAGRTPTRIIEHGVPAPKNVYYTGELARGISVVNHLARRGRRLGADVFERVRRDVPIDLVGMAAEELGGVGEVPPPQLAAFEAKYRFFFNPIRWTSLGLAVIEAMMLGLPIIGLATTEVATVIQNGRSGYVDTNIDKLIAHGKRLLADPDEARALGENARQDALERFGIERFARDWEATFAEVCGRSSLPENNVLGRAPAVA